MNRWLVFTVSLVMALSLLSSSATAAVTISNFNAQWEGKQVQVGWITATELNNSGFYILRSTSANGTFTRISSFIPSETMGSAMGSEYAFTDAAVVAGQTYYYKLESLDDKNNSQFYGPVAASPSGSSPTPTRTPTKGATSTPTRTATGVPASSTPTSTPQFTPTRTPTYPPGVTPPTPLPTATPTTAKVAIVVVPATATPLRPANPAVPKSGALVTEPTAAPTQVAAADPSANSTEASEDNSADQSNVDSTASFNPISILLQAGVFVVSGMLALGALISGALAVFLYWRMSKP